jgi:hypothetical protein
MRRLNAHVKDMDHGNHNLTHTDVGSVGYCSTESTSVRRQPSGC